MGGAGIGSGKVIEQLGLVGASVLERMGTTEELGRIDDVGRGKGIDGVGTHALVAGDARKPAREERGDVTRDLLGIELDTLGSQRIKRTGNEVAEGKLGKRPEKCDDANGGSTDGERVGGASG